MQKTKFYFLIPILLTIIFSAHAEESLKFKDITIVVSSGDKYAEFWDPFFTLLFKNWPSLNTANKDIPIILITNKRAYTNPRVQNIQILNDKGWSDNMVDVLKQVKTKYVLYLQEDHFITSLDEKRLHDLVQLLQKDSIAYIQIAALVPIQLTGEDYPKSVNVKHKGRYDPWRTSLESCLWKKEDLELLIKPGESPWDFECAGSIRSQGMRNSFLAVSAHPPIAYLNMAYRGYLNTSVLPTLDNMGIHIKNGTLPLDKDHRLILWFKIELPQILYNNILIPAKNLYKKMIG
jgi:hypothetical protein